MGLLVIGKNFLEELHVMLPELKFGKMKIRAASLGEQSSVPDLLGEMIHQNHLQFCLGESDEIYEGYGRRANAYPYRQYNSYRRELSEKELRTAVLENDYLRAVFLPEYGGRLWQLWDKKAGRNLLYTNDILRFSNLAVRNAWFSGGVEWNIGVIGHTPLTTEPLYTAETEMENGVPVLRMYEYERIRGVPYQIDFWLEEDSPFLNCRMRIANESGEVLPMYWWSNIAVEEYENGRIIVPSEEAFTFEDGTVVKLPVPVVKGIDITDYKKIDKSTDYFFVIAEKSPKYIANVDGTGYGLLHISTGRLKSRKLFSWGNNDASDRWQEFLTDKAGRYIEIQAGLAKTQYGCLPMAPHTAWEWMEQYGPVQICEETLNQNHRERVRRFTEELHIGQAWENMERKLAETKPMARSRARLVFAGSGYGALKKQGEMTEHLEFAIKEDSLEKWKKFFETSVLHCPEPSQRPDEFLIDETNVSFLKDNIKTLNDKNWYAYYHMGLGFYARREYKKAGKALKKSLSLAENPWAYHALGCISMIRDKTAHAVEYIVKGMEMRRSDHSYLKEGFRILSLCGADQTLCDFYESMDTEEKNISKIRFYYISSMHRLGRDKEAYELLEENGGLEIEDIREGEDSVARLWSELHQSLYGSAAKIPHRYNFKAY